MKINGHSIPEAAVTGLRKRHWSSDFNQRFCDVFGVVTRGAQLDQIDFIAGLGATFWIDCPDEILSPSDLDPTSLRIHKEQSVRIGQVTTDQPIVIDFAAGTPRVVGMLGDEVMRWETLSETVEGFFELLELGSLDSE